MRSLSFIFYSETFCIRQLSSRALVGIGFNPFNPFGLGSVVCLSEKRLYYCLCVVLAGAMSVQQIPVRERRDAGELEDEWEDIPDSVEKGKE